MAFLPNWKELMIPYSDRLADIMRTQNKFLIYYIRQHQQNAQYYFT